MSTNEGLDDLSENCFKKALQLIHSLTGISIAESRKSMVQGRLRKRAAELKMESYDQYLAFVEQNNDEKVKFIDIVTTNETYFFRTPRIWTYIQDVFLPEWIKRNEGKPFHAWSAAASTGDEAHSLGVLLQAFRDKNPKFSYQILGTDISREMVEICKVGVYKGRAIESFKSSKPDLFLKYMKAGNADGFQVIPEIKARLKFQEHNLFRPLLLKESFDLVLVRNVLIYFKGEDQEKVLKLIEPKLQEDGTLIIGESESLTHIKTGYLPVQPLIYRKNSTSSEKKVA